MKIIKKIALYLLTLAVFTLGGLIAPLFGVSFIHGAVISLLGCLIHVSIVSFVNFASILLKKLNDGKPDA